jgi:hypothetical protein
VVHHVYRDSAAGKEAPFGIHKIRDERCANSHLAGGDRGWSGRDVEDTVAAEALQPTHGMAPALTRSRGRAGAGQLLQMWMREIQTCGHRNYDEASGVK